MNHVLAALRTSGEVVLPDGSREPLHSHLPELECAVLDFFYVNRMLAIGGIVVFDDLQCPSIERVAAFVDSLPAYRRLELPAAIAGDRTVRIRRMAGQHPVRVVGFEKIAADTRPWNWHERF